jgi:ABC-type transporter Mla subunit MlaD
MRRASIAANPVLIGAATTLVVIVAVFLAYNANAGLPFVPTYQLDMQVPNAANLVVGNEVRVGGTRVGVIDKIDVKTRRNGANYAILHTKLETSVQPLPVDSTILIRPRSALGLKYVAVTKGTSSKGFPDGGTIPEKQAVPEPVEFDQFLSMFNEPTRVASRVNLFEFGNGLAGRGGDVNNAIEIAPPLLKVLQPVAKSLAAPDTKLDNLFRALGRTAREVAPVGQQQAQLFTGLDRTFGALAKVAVPYIQDSITNGVIAQEQAIESFPTQQAFLKNSAELMVDLQPATKALQTAVPDLSDAVTVGTPALQRSVKFNQQLIPVFDKVQNFATDPLVTLGVKDLTTGLQVLQPTLEFFTPTQSVCNYVTLLLENGSSLLSEGDKVGTAQRFAVVAAPYNQTDPSRTKNTEALPSNAPANGPDTANFLHSNNYPNTAAPGQPKECEAGNEPYIVGKQVIGNAPGTQTTKTRGN